MDRGAWQATSPWGRKESGTTERLTISHFSLSHLNSICQEGAGGT